MVKGLPFFFYSDGDEGSMVPDVDFEVQDLLAVCYGDPNNLNKPVLYFKVCKRQICWHTSTLSFKCA